MRERRKKEPRTLASCDSYVRLLDAGDPCRVGSRFCSRLGGATDLRHIDTYPGQGGEARGGYEYRALRTRHGRPLEECMAALEGGRHGLAFASGLAGEDTSLRTIASPGSHFVVPDDAYGGTFRLFARVHQRWGVAADPAHLTNLDTVAAAITPGETKAVGSRRPPTRCSTLPTSPRLWIWRTRQVPW